MRFEFFVLMSQLAMIPLVASMYGFRNAILSFSLFLYGPAASLVKISLGPAIFPLGSLIALCGIVIIISFNKINRFVFQYLFATLLTIVFISLLSFNVTAFISSIHFLLYLLFGLLLGAYAYRLEEYDKSILIKSIIFTAATSFIALILIRFIGVYVTDTLVDMRDVGFGMLPMLVIFLVLQQESKLKVFFKVLIPFAYLLISLTRSYLLDLVLVIIYARKRLVRGIFFKPMLFILLIIGISFIFLSRASSASNPDPNATNQEQYEEVAAALTLTTRLNGLLTEWEDFKSSPIVGNGIGYYMDDFDEMFSKGLDTISDADYIAYNHIGVISVLAQGGILLFVMLIIIPFHIIFRIRKKIFSSQDYLLFACFCLYVGYFILFFISGSPIRKDYSDGILFYFIIGYIFCFYGDDKKRRMLKIRD